jgi:hypothetical protein
VFADRRPEEGMNGGLDLDIIKVAVINNVTYTVPGIREEPG